MFEDFLFNILEKLLIYVFLPLFLIFMVVFVVALPFMVWNSIQEANHCAKWENKIVHQESYYTYVYTGKVMVPIYHPAGNYDKSVCVEIKN